MPNHRAWLVVAACLSLCAGGCLTIYSKTEVIRGDEARRPIRFESALAAHHFNTHMEDQSAQLAHSHLSLPFVTFYSRQQVLSDNAFFNDQVGKCDTDQDGVISLEEAKVYARVEADDFLDTWQTLHQKASVPPLQPVSSAANPLNRTSGSE
jgi:hypothetical protein